MTSAATRLATRIASSSSVSSRVASRVVSSMASSVYSSVSTRRARMLCHGSGWSVESRQMRLQEDARADCPHQCCSEQGKYKCRQRHFHHAVDANDTVEVWESRSSYNGCRQGKQVELWHLEECDLRIKAWEAREIQLEVRVGAKRECLPKMKHDRVDDSAEDEQRRGLARLLISTIPCKPWSRQSVKCDETAHGR